MSDTKIRDDFTDTLQHLESICDKLDPVTGGRGRTFTFPDGHKISEGLFLSSWTHWEQFVRRLFVQDLATNSAGALQREVKQFRTKGAPMRLAESIVGHPDSRRWVEWSDYSDVVRRADALLGPSSRFAASVDQQKLALLRRIRNAIAHKSDKAWQSFRDLAKAPPFSLATKQMMGITVGRFLIAHNWNGRPVIRESLHLLQHEARALVP